MFRHHPFLTIVTLVYLGVVGWITLGPQPVAQERLFFRVLGWAQQYGWFTWVTYNGVEFAANVLMFLPMGLFFLLLLGRRLWWLAAVMGAVLSGLIEFGQLFLPSRVSDPRDFVANSIGAVIGVLVGLVVTWPAAIRRRRAAAERHRVRV